MTTEGNRSPKSEKSASGPQTKEEIRQERDELQASFDLRWKADMRAIKLWQKAHPDKEHVWPDHADLVVWLLERQDEIDRRYTEFIRFVDKNDPSITDAWALMEGTP